MSHAFVCAFNHTDCLRHGLLTNSCSLRANKYKIVNLIAFWDNTSSVTLFRLPMQHYICASLFTFSRDHEFEEVSRLLLRNSFLISGVSVSGNHVVLLDIFSCFCLSLLDRYIPNGTILFDTIRNYTDLTEVSPLWNVSSFGCSNISSLSSDSVFGSSSMTLQYEISFLSVSLFSLRQSLLDNLLPFSQSRCLRVLCFLSTSTTESSFRARSRSYCASRPILRRILSHDGWASNRCIRTTLLKPTQKLTRSWNPTEQIRTLPPSASQEKLIVQRSSITCR